MIQLAPHRCPPLRTGHFQVYHVSLPIIITVSFPGLTFERAAFLSACCSTSTSATVRPSAEAKTRSLVTSTRMLVVQAVIPQFCNVYYRAFSTGKFIGIAASCELVHRSIGAPRLLGRLPEKNN